MDDSTLTERLRGVVRTSSTFAPRATVDKLTSVPPATLALNVTVDEARRADEVQTSALEDALEGQWRPLDTGRTFVVERRLEAAEPYGRSTIGEIASRIAGGASDASILIDARPGSPFVFFDLETTGLSGGAGSFAFLVGCGWFDAGGAFVTRQYLLVRIADERPMLEAVAADLERAGVLVSFNGKSFDVPVLETRYALHRLDVRLLDRAVHFDVLHPARRFWSVTEDAAGRSCSLSSLEEQILRVRRRGDVGGAEIPWRYFQFIRSGDAAPLGAVLEHNRLDLVSLAGLTARLLELAAVGADAAWNAREMLALGRAYARAGREALARETLERVVRCASDAATSMEARRWLAIGARRSRRHEEAARHWHAIVNTAGCPAPLAREASEALAVHHEHRVHDLGKARTYALKSLVGSGRPAWTEAARYRLARLERKMAGAPLLDC